MWPGRQGPRCHDLGGGNLRNTGVERRIALSPCLPDLNGNQRERARHFRGAFRAGLDFAAPPGQSLQMTIQTMTPRNPATAAAPEQITFDRSELAQILGLYGRMVAAGEWRDYGM